MFLTYKTGQGFFAGDNSDFLKRISHTVFASRHLSLGPIVAPEAHPSTPSSELRFPNALILEFADLDTLAMAVRN